MIVEQFVVQQSAKSFDPSQMEAGAGPTGDQLTGVQYPPLARDV